MPALIASIAAWIAAGVSKVFASRLGTWIAGAMVWLGLSWSTQHVVIAPILSQMQSVASGLPGDALGWFAFLNFDRYLSAIISAYGAAASVTGVRAVLTRRAT